MTSPSTLAPPVLTDRQRAVIECLCVGGHAPQAALTRLAGAEPETIRSLVTLGLVRETKAGARDALYHATRDARSLVTYSTETEAPPMSATETTEKTAPTADAGDLAGPAKPAPKPEKTKTAAASKRTPKTPPADATAADVTGKANEALPPKTGGGERKSLPDATQKKVDAAVKTVVPEDDAFFKHAQRYGTKIAKQKKGLRESAPPLAGLSKERGDAVAKAVLEAIS